MIEHNYANLIRLSFTSVILGFVSAAIKNIISTKYYRYTVLDNQYINEVNIIFCFRLSVEKVNECTFI